MHVLRISGILRHHIAGSGARPKRPRIRTHVGVPFAGLRRRRCVCPGRHRAVTQSPSPMRGPAFGFGERIAAQPALENVQVVLEGPPDRVEPLHRLPADRAFDFDGWRGVFDHRRSMHAPAGSGIAADQAGWSWRSTKIMRRPGMCFSAFERLQTRPSKRTSPAAKVSDAWTMMARDRDEIDRDPPLARQAPMPPSRRPGPRGAASAAPRRRPPSAKKPRGAGPVAMDETHFRQSAAGR